VNENTVWTQVEVIGNLSKQSSYR